VRVERKGNGSIIDFIEKRQHLNLGEVRKKSRYWTKGIDEPNPKIPMLVTNIKTTTAETKYDLINKGALDQFCFNQIVATSLLTSSVVPMIIMGIAAAAKIAVSPTTE
jgi:hypothetical protein